MHTKTTKKKRKTLTLHGIKATASSSTSTVLNPRPLSSLGVIKQPSGDFLSFLLRQLDFIQGRGHVIVRRGSLVAEGGVRRRVGGDRSRESSLPPRRWGRLIVVVLPLVGVRRAVVDLVRHYYDFPVDAERYL